MRPISYIALSYPPTSALSITGDINPDILLIVPTISALESLLRACEIVIIVGHEYQCKNSSCIYFCHHYNVTCASITTRQASPYNWCLSSDIWVCSLFHHDLSNVLLWISPVAYQRYYNMRGKWRHPVTLYQTFPPRAGVNHWQG